MAVPSGCDQGNGWVPARHCHLHVCICILLRIDYSVETLHLNPSVKKGKSITIVWATNTLSKDRQFCTCMGCISEAMWIEWGYLYISSTYVCIPSCHAVVREYVSERVCFTSVVSRSSVHDRPLFLFPRAILLPVVVPVKWVSPSSTTLILIYIPYSCHRCQMILLLILMLFSPPPPLIAIQARVCIYI